MESFIGDKTVSSAESIVNTQKQNKIFTIFHIIAFTTGIVLTLLAGLTGSLGMSYLGTCSFRFGAGWAKYLYGSVFVSMFLFGILFIIRRYCFCQRGIKDEEILYPLKNIPIYIGFTLLGWFASYLSLTITEINQDQKEVVNDIRSVSIWGNLITMICITTYRCTSNYIIDYIKQGDTKNLFVNSIMIFFCQDEISKNLELSEKEKIDIHDIDDEVPF